MIYKLLPLFLLLGCVTTQETSPIYSVGTCVQIFDPANPTPDPDMTAQVIGFRLRSQGEGLEVKYAYSYWMQEHQQWSDPQTGIGDLAVFEKLTYQIECPK